MNTTWKKLITEEMRRRGEDWVRMAACTLAENELNRCFPLNHRGPNGEPFFLWTTKRVYFSTQYDGLDGVASVPRYPDGTPAEVVPA